MDDYGRRVVSKEEGIQFASLNELPFYETSAKKNTNIDELFDGLIDLLLTPRPVASGGAGGALTPEEEEKKKACCCFV